MYLVFADHELQKQFFVFAVSDYVWFISLFMWFMWYIIWFICSNPLRHRAR